MLGGIKMTKIAILTDSGCQMDISKSVQEGIYIVPLSVTIKDESYLEGLDISAKEVFDRMQKEDILASSSQPPYGYIVEALQQIKEAQYDEVIGISIATGLSSTLSSFESAAQQVGVDLYPVDSKGTAGNQKYLVEVAASLIKEGKSAQEIKDILDDLVKDSATLIMVPNLQHLKRGGRITPSVALLAGMLKIVPVMKLNANLGGKIDTFTKVRTIRKANHVIIDHLIECGVNCHDYVLTIEHVLEEDLACEMKELLIQKIGPCDIHVGDLPAVVGVHMGVGGIGYQYIKKYQGASS